MKRLFLIVLAVLAAAPAALAQERRTTTQAELDQMLAPIALYPDALLSQVLMASTYPLDIVEAARWTRAYPGLQGDEAVSRVAGEDWDPSVKSLVAFPRLLQRMDENLAWTRSLGEAFLEQEPHVMQTVQQLRRKAQVEGQLASDERLRIVDQGDVIVIEPAHPQVVYVPYYDPLVVYGSWWWPAFPPVIWAPWPGYVVYRPGFWWGTGVAVTTRFFFGGVDWHHRHVKVVHVDNHYVRPLRSSVVRPLQVGKWQPAPRRELRRRSERPGHFVPHARPMPPALSASPPVRRVEQPRRAEVPRMQSQPQVQPGRVEVPRMQSQPQVQPRRAEVPRMQSQPQVQPRRAEVPRMQPQPQVQPRFGVQAPRQETRPQFRAPPRGGGGGREGGWQRQAERNGRRG